jgi:hypothetical protein
MPGVAGRDMPLATRRFHLPLSARARAPCPGVSAPPFLCSHTRAVFPAAQRKSKPFGMTAPRSEAYKQHGAQRVVGSARFTDRPNMHVGWLVDLTARTATWEAGASLTYDGLENSTLRLSSSAIDRTAFASRTRAFSLPKWPEISAQATSKASPMAPLFQSTTYAIAIG